MSLFQETVKCPVCKSRLGAREKNELFIGHCEECHASFIWRKNSKKPESKLDVDQPKRCGCQNCGR